MSEFFVKTQDVMNQITRIVDVKSSVNSVKKQVQSVNNGLYSIGLNDIAPVLILLENSLAAHVTKVNLLGSKLNMMMHKYKSTESAVASQVNKKSDIYAMSHAKDALVEPMNIIYRAGSSTGSGSVEYDWEKIHELMEMKPELLTEEELRYLSEVIRSLSVEEMDEFVNAAMIDSEKFKGYITGSDNVFAALCAAQYELYGMMMSGEISEDEYISEMMKITMLANACSEYKIPSLDLSDYRYTQDPNDSGMLDSNFPASWVREEGDCFHVLWKYKFDWVDTVRYMGDGSTANIVIDINDRYKSMKENSALNLLVKNIAETALLVGVSSNPLVSGAVTVGYGFVNDIIDTSSSKISMNDMINTFELNVVETETFVSDSWIWGMETEKEYNMFPSSSTQAEIEKFNTQVSQLRSDYINTDRNVTLKGAALEEIIRMDSDNEFFTLGKDSNGNVYVKDIQDLSVYDILNSPNKANELYYVVNLLEN